MGTDAAAPAGAWLRENAWAPEDYLVSLYKSHQVVIFGEQHNIHEHKTFVAGLLGRLYSEADVQCLAWEFSCPEDNDRLQHLVTADTFDEAALLALARDQYLDWNSADHWDLVREVWGVNQARPVGKAPMRMVGLRSRWVIDAHQEICSMTPGSPRYWELLALVGREDDAGMAGQVEREIITRGVKGFVFVGQAHDMTKYEYPAEPPKWLLKRLPMESMPADFFPADKPWRTTMGRLLYQKYADRVFQVCPYAGLFPDIEKVMAEANLGKAGFTVEGGPFADMKAGSGFYDTPMKLLAQGFVYLGPRSTLHANRVIRGFVSQEMFERHRAYYERDYSRCFVNAQDVDEHLQKHRWRAP